MYKCSVWGFFLQIFLLHGPLTQQFQVRDGDLSLLVTALSHQPIRVHSRDGVDGDQLPDKDASRKCF